MKVGIITTINHNIGDDFVRVGIVSLINELTHGTRVEFVLISKHEPLSVYPVSHPLHWVGQLAGKLPRGRRRVEAYSEQLLYKVGKNRFDGCDMIVQSGAPVIFDGCADAEWSVPIWEHIVGRLSSSVTVMNLAAGTCYPWENPPSVVSSPEDAVFLRKISGYCRLTTVRERLAVRLMADVGVNTPILPCTAFLSAENLISSATESSPIYINYMEGAGHYSFGQTVSSSTWDRTLKELVKRLEKRHVIKFLCHTKKEYTLAQREFPEFEAIYPNSVEEYYRVISNAKCGIYNRLHASVALGGIGVPSIAIGTDTRMLMLDEIGLPYRFVSAANVDEIEDSVEGLLAKRASEKHRLIELRARTKRQYLELLRPCIASA